MATVIPVKREPLSVLNYSIFNLSQLVLQIFCLLEQSIDTLKKCVIH